MLTRSLDPITQGNTELANLIGSELHILGQLLYRNKNSLRQALWFKQLSQIVRFVRQFIRVAPESFDEKRQSHRFKFQSNDKFFIEKFRHKLLFLIVPAFGQLRSLILGGHYTSLGLVIISSLGKIYSCIFQNQHIQRCNTDLIQNEKYSFSDEDLGQAIEITSTSIGNILFADNQSSDIKSHDQLRDEASASDSDVFGKSSAVGQIGSVIVDSVFETSHSSEPLIKRRKGKNKKRKPDKMTIRNDIDNIFNV